MPETTGQAGRSITPAYDVLGTRGGPGQLLTEQGIYLQHDMHRCLTQERGVVGIRRIANLGQLQSTTEVVLLSVLPQFMFHWQGILVLTSDISKLSALSVALTIPDFTRMFPIFAWNTFEGVGITIPVVDPDVGGDLAVVLINQLENDLIGFPFLASGDKQAQQLSDLRMAITTTAFGGGTVDHVLLASLSSAQIGGISSFGIAPPGP